MVPASVARRSSLRNRIRRRIRAAVRGLGARADRLPVTIIARPEAATASFSAIVRDVRQAMQGR